MKLVAGAMAITFAAFAAEPALVSVRLEPAARTLRGSGAAQQFLAIGTMSDGLERDLTAEVSWAVSDPGRASIAATGKLDARKEGAVVVTARVKAATASAKVQIEDIAASREFSFGFDIGGILTRQGCNGAACHGGVKGRGGFKLSAGALHPNDDFEWIVKGGGYQVLTTEVKGSRVPRIDLANPEKSLLLQKATGSVAHGGGKRFAVGSPEYQIVLDWVRKGAPFGPADLRENKVVRLEVFPKIVTLEKNAKHRLLVTAHLADGRLQDFTDQALYISNDKDVADVNSAGVVSGGRLGETAILIRAAGQASSATVGVIGPALARFPSVAPANFIDGYVFDKLRKFRIPPSEQSSDGEFLRRVCLDLTGMLPPPARVREFLADKDPHKREKLINLLIGSPEFIDYWTFRFDDVFRVAVFANGIQPKWSQMYGEWVRESIAKNKPYDQMAKERLVAQGYDGPTRHLLPYDVIGPPGEVMAEEVRVFFGRRLDCAQCHNHPYEAWSQDQFWGMAAFFSRVFKMGDTGNEYVIFDHPVNQPMGNGDVDGNIKIFHPRTKAELKPVLLDGRAVNASDKENPRKALADWMVTHPYFAEAAVNRMWAYFFGRGLVDPVDDFRSTNPPTHPELLDRLAADFRKNGHDLRHLIRLIVSSRTYQLSGIATAANRDDRTNYSHALARPMDAEVLLDAICDVTGVPETFSTGVSDTTKAAGQAPLGMRAIQLRESDLFFSRFLELYGRPNRLTMPERSSKANLGEALNLLAGPVYNEKIHSPESRLQKLLGSGKSDRDIVEEFYLAAFGRLPEREELEGIEKLIAERKNREEAFQDLVWAMLGSREFAENH
ncbi:MAG TPA: DUF1553 domain-containing protein [Bryobacteraceae bacterium]|nr:DUF1553 domain-containing protein [Bryobacteraceae bacterium]